MDKQSPILIGVGLILLGALALAFNVAGSILGLNVWGWGVARFWPLLVVMVGWLFILFPVLVRGWRGLGGFLIPGVPILTTGGILLLGSVFNWWGVWEWLWP